MRFDPTEESAATLRKFRWVLGFFMFGLVLSGVTAFPLKRELEMLVAWRGLDHALPAGALHGLDSWILLVHHGLQDTYAKYPWVAYGTDWLAFAHIVIAVFFIGPFINPVRNLWTLQAGLIACVLVIPLALICGPIRQIPMGWQLIDCSFGILGAIPLWYCLRLARRLERNITRFAEKWTHVTANARLDKGIPHRLK